MSNWPAVWATLLVLAPTIAALVIRLERLPPRQAAAWAAAASLFSLSVASGLLIEIPQGVWTIWTWSPALHLEVSWRLEVATLALVMLVAGIGLLVLQYAGSYFADNQEAGRTIALLAAFESAMLGLVLADNLLLLYVFWELTGICSYFLISSDRAKGEAGLRAASHALLITVAGGLSMLVGMLYLIAESGTASLTALLTMDIDPTVRTVALALLLPAVLTKSAQVPTHFWLPGAMAAPTPVSAYLHSATMVKAGIILLLYLYPLLGQSPLWTWILLPVGAVTCIWGSLRALAQSDIKMLMAWSTVSQLGLITLTIGLGTDVAIRAAILHLFAHAIFKAGLFLTVGGVDHAAHSRSLFKLGGLWRRIPLLALAAALLAGSMAGIPPLAGFLSKELILKKAMLADLWVHALAVVAIVVGSVGTVAYSSRFFFEVFTRQPRSEQAREAARLPVGLIAAPTALAALTLLAGPVAPWVDRWFLEPVAFSIVGAPLEVKQLSLWYGINAALLLSVAIVSTGYFVDRLLGLKFVRQETERWWHGPRLFDSIMELAQRGGELIARTLADTSPRVYLAVAIGLGMLPGLALAPTIARVDWRSITGPGILLLAVLATLLLFLVAARRPLPRVLILTAVGFVVAMAFRLANGPDLMLTQLLVELLITIFVALALWALPQGRPQGPAVLKRPWHLARVLLAVTAGVSGAAWVAALGSARSDEHVANFVREQAPEIAQGGNLVNVVLTDVRSLDTLMETVVVVLGALGVVALLSGRERTGTDTPVGRSVSRGLLPGLAKAILPVGVLFALTLLAKGHNDPGGGFVAGLSLGGTVMIAVVAFGPARFTQGLRISLSGLAIFGCLLMLASGSLGWLAGKPYLTQLHAKLSIASLSLPLHTTWIFDAGVALAVAGAIGAAGLAFWSTATDPRSGEVR